MVGTTKADKALSGLLSILKLTESQVVRFPSSDPKVLISNVSVRSVGKFSKSHVQLVI